MNLYISASSSPLVLVIFILLSAQVPTSLSAGNGTYEVCSRPLRCGTFQNVTYPFWGIDRPEYCGHPGMELTCQGGQELRITIMSISYKVIEINTDMQAFSVARADYLNTLCPQKHANTSLDFQVFSYAWNLENITLYYDCPRISNLSAGFPSQFNCSSNNGTDLFNYFVTASAFGNLSAEVQGGLRSCRSSVLVPAFYTAVESIENNPIPDTLVLPLRNGFGLRWDTNLAGKCTACRASGGMCGYNRTLSEFTCFCTDHTDPSTCSSGSSNSGSTKIIIGLTVAGAAIVVVCVIVFITLRRKKSSFLIPRSNKKTSERIEAFIMKYGTDLAPKRFSYSDIKKITKSFKDKLGEGGFGTVFKGKLSDDRLVAVKVLSESSGDGEVFINEVASISRTSHVNVVTFLGFCYEYSVRALIYEFMPNGSLDKYICHEGSTDESHILEHRTLFDIAIGIGRGLEYLHGGCNTRILHLDIKPHNILLDENFCPKISDFGLAKLCERKESILSMISARGTIGYIAPELFCRNFGGVSYKSDVYSYGMMVLEMIGAKENVHNGPSVTTDLNFPLWVYEHLQQEAYLNLQGITAEEEEITKKMIVVSLWCIQTNPSDRPSMTKVLEMLQGSLQSLAIPPRPFLFSPQRSPPNTSEITLFGSSINTMHSEL